MNRRRPARPNWFRIILLCLLVLGGSYMNRYIVVNDVQVGVPTPTATRAPESYLTEAEENFNQGKLIAAIDSYQQAISVRPEDPTIHIALARVQIWAGQYEEAEVSAKDALLLDPANPMAFAVLAWAQNFRQDYLAAESSIRRSLELDPNNALAYAYYVEILLDSFQYGSGSFENVERAIEQSKVAVALAPEALETRRARGYVLEVTANYEEAIREYQAAVAINPNIADLHLALGGNYTALGDYVQAVEEYTRANALNPEDPTPDLLISRVYATTGDYTKALQYAEQAVNENPADTGLRGNYGLMFYENAYYAEAAEQLGYVVNGGTTEEGVTLNAIPLGPGNIRLAGYYSTYGFALEASNRCGEALTVAQTILARIPGDETAVSNAGEIIARCEADLTRPALPTTTPAAAGETATATPTP